MGDFGFGVMTGTTSCPEMKVFVQHYQSQDPVEFIVAANFGTPTIRFADDTVLFIRQHEDSTEYELVVSKKAMAKVRKQYEE
jgi:hypothetical protein